MFGIALAFAGLFCYFGFDYLVFRCAAGFGCDLCFGLFGILVLFILCAGGLMGLVCLMLFGVG